MHDDDRLNAKARVNPGACSGVSGRLNIMFFSLGIEDSSQLAAGFFNMKSL